MKHQRLELELFQAFADITRIMAAIATFSFPHVDQEILKYRGPDQAIFVRKVARGGMRRHREQLGFTRIHVRRERHERVTQLLDRFLVSRPNRVYAKAECNDENNRSNHVSKVGKD